MQKSTQIDNRREKTTQIFLPLHINEMDLDEQ